MNVRKHLWNAVFWKTLKLTISFEIIFLLWKSACVCRKFKLCMNEISCYHDIRLYYVRAWRNSSLIDWYTSSLQTFYYYHSIQRFLKTRWKFFGVFCMEVWHKWYIWCFQPYGVALFKFKNITTEGFSQKLLFDSVNELRFAYLYDTL